MWMLSSNTNTENSDFLCKIPIIINVAIVKSVILWFIWLSDYEQLIYSIQKMGGIYPKNLFSFFFGRWGGGGGVGT